MRCHICNVANINPLQRWKKSMCICGRYRVEFTIGSGACLYRTPPHPISINIQTSASSLYEVWILSFPNIPPESRWHSVGVCVAKHSPAADTTDDGGMSQSARRDNNTCSAASLACTFTGTLFICFTVLGWHAAWLERFLQYTDVELDVFWDLLKRPSHYPWVLKKIK